MDAPEDSLRYGPIGSRCLHLCVDMQCMFAEETDWHTPWMVRALPNVVRLVARHPTRTLFTRFIPAARPGEGRGTWARYYERWADMTRDRLAPGMVDLVPELAPFAAQAQTFDKTLYSPWIESDLDVRLAQQGIDTLVVSGGETDVCVLSTVLGAVDRGYRVVVATDALCSSSDAAHDALMTLYRSRYGQQVETVSTATVLEHWT